MAEEKDGTRGQQLVVPGEVITEEHVKLGPGVYVHGGKVVAGVLGFADVAHGTARVISLGGKYLPRVGDSIIGMIVDVKVPGYDVDVNSPYTVFLPKDAVEGDADYGDVIVGTIKYVDEVRNALLTNAVVLKGGELIHIPPSRVPRVIGKNASMVNLLKSKTGAAILVGANGRIWIHGGHAGIAKEAILEIDREAHTSGLTDRITKFLKDNIPEEESGEDAE